MWIEERRGDMRKIAGLTYYPNIGKRRDGVLYREVPEEKESLKGGGGKSKNTEVKANKS